MNNEKLEIVIPTWNRAKYLERTLSQFKNSPFKNYKITIIDNNSTDNTQEICEKYQRIFPKLNVMKNNKNIGGCANILRCYEIATAKYTWVVGDNDQYDFTYSDGIINIINNDEFDLIFIQWLEQINIKKTTVKELFENNHGDELIGMMGAISSYIYKTELYTSDCIQEGYLIAKYLYPHLVFAKKACDNNFSVFISPKFLRLPDENPNVSYNMLNLVNGWVSSIAIFDKKYYKYGLKRVLGTHLLIASIAAVIKVKAHKINYKLTLNELILSIIETKGLFIGLGYAIILKLISFIPYNLSKFILNKYAKNKNVTN